MSAPPTTGSFADEVYERLRPLAGRDEALGWPLLHYVSVLGLPFQLVEDVARDDDLGPGWAVLLDPDRSPSWALGWLGQAGGVRLLPRTAAESESDWDAAMRVRIKRADGRWRGSPDALAAAIQRHLTGTKYVIFNERVGGHAYRLAVRTLESETPDPAAVLRAALEQKPAGIKLDYAAVPGQTWDALVAAHDDWAAVQAHYDTWDETRQNLP